MNFCDIALNNPQQHYQALLTWEFPLGFSMCFDRLQCLILDRAFTELSELTCVNFKSLPDSQRKKEIGNLPEYGALGSL